MRIYKISGFLFLLFLLNYGTIQKPKIDESYSIIYSDPLFLRVISLNGRYLLADKFWLLSKYIDETKKKEDVDSDELFNFYKNLILLDSTLEIAVIYSSTYLASNKNRYDLAIALLKIAQLFSPNNFQYVFTELVFNVVYKENQDIEHLKKMAKKIAKMPNKEKYIGRIDVNKWVDDIILYLQKDIVKKQILEEDRKWLDSIKK